MFKIPKVQVPMDFGVQYLGLPSHSNLRFLLGNGEELLANSMIMSFNSPVIEEMTTNLFQHTIQVQDFTKNAVQCFLEASYSGGIADKISKSNFREVNKMAHLFEVGWLIEGCFGYFKTLTFGMETDNFSEQLYVFNEAMFVMKNLKKRNYIEIVIKGFSTKLSETRYFITNYLNTAPSQCSAAHLDVIFEIAESKEYILLEALVEQLDKSKYSISSNGRYILNKVCAIERLRFTHKSLYKNLLKKLEGIENPSGEDFMLILKIRQESQKKSKIQASIPYATIPNLFHDYEKLKSIGDIDSLFKFLVEAPEVTNCYMFYDAVAIWLNQKGYSSYAQFIPEGLVERFAEHKHRRGWKPLSLHYIGADTANSFNRKIFENMNPSLITYNRYHRIESVRGYTPDELFAKDHDMKFKFKEESIKECNKKGDCGFILRVTAGSSKKDNNFDIGLLTEPKLYPEDIHFHDESLSMIDAIHFTLDVTENDGPTKDPTFPTVPWDSLKVTWYGKPRRDATNKYWSWGAHRFHKKGSGRPHPGDRYKRGQYFGDSSAIRLRPAVYYFR